MKRKEIDFLQGTIGNKLLLFAIPLAITAFIQQLFSAADVAMVGNLVGKNAMAAVGGNTPITGLLQSVFIGISLGVTVVVSNYIGQNNNGKLPKAVRTIILLAVLCGIGVMIVGAVIAEPLLKALSVDSEILDMAVLYLRIYVIGMPFLIVVNFESAIFRGQGDAQKPLICMLIMGVIKIVLNYIFLAFFKMSVAGVALATVISNAVGAGLLFAFLLRSGSSIRLRFDEYSLDLQTVASVLRIGLPSGLQTVVFSLSTILLQSAINSLGVDAIAAASAAFNIEMYVYYAINSVGQACTTFVGQNFGAENEKRCRQGTKIALVQCIAVTAVFSAVALIFGRRLLALFNQDPAVIELGIVRLRIVITAEIVNGIVEILSSSMRGRGKSLQPAIITLVSVCSIRIFWVYSVFRAYPTFYTISLVFPVSWIINGAALFVAYVIFSKKNMEGIRTHSK